MRPEVLNRLSRYRAELTAEQVPAAVVEQWTDAALPCATLTLNGAGPTVGRYGGPLLLPPDAPDPEFPLVASLNCADLSEEVTGLPLPPDGRLLLFGFPDPDAGGEVMYVPEGATVEERAGIFDYSEENGLEDWREIHEAFWQGDLHLTADVSLPFHSCKAVATARGWRSEELPWAPYDTVHDALLDVCASGFPAGGWVQVGGHPKHESMDTNPVESVAIHADETGDLRDWVLLAEWHPNIEGREGLSLHWAIRRQALAARRFDLVEVTMSWNP
ncbi:hypothetical protein BU52_22810 [Streptomyces toyocaensis]|uniref:DUF1963 domain-containing protein n=1 Tax=Streptomyces toyocaensis TaxID=55952 RepID=A0A081XMV3_STRTO|nr:DUF1963 domain-containing protein [Streptomyces toyocaensis]KES04876.1 hypothetical protein BU52_22810 [Streptomyces toyocaensis]